MLHPVGPEPPSVYWRRRLTLLASVITLVVLLIVTVRVLLSDSGSSGTTAGGQRTSPVGNPATPSQTPAPSTSAPAVSSSAPGSSSSASTSQSGSSTSSSSSSPPPPKKCTASDLSLAAATEKDRYKVGDQPALSIVVTNKSKAPCVQDLADPQIVLRVYNGESRVWGSHDCKIEPGTDDRTLMAGATVRVTIVWSGLTSHAKCAGTRQRVGAGTYTLFASLSGHEAKAAQFTIS
jgi:hypothetical protein